MRLRVRIERLVISETQVEAIRRALGTELSRLAAGQADHVLVRGQRTIDSLSTRVAEPNADATRLGRDVARTVHGALTSG
jgi:hypothetical protein